MLSVEQASSQEMRGMIEMVDKWTDRRAKAKETAKERNFRDVIYTKLKGNKHAILIDITCGKTGHRLGRYEIVHPHFVGDQLTETANNYLEHELIKNKLISPRECDLDILLMQERAA
jgi:hypothetical protein